MKTASLEPQLLHNESLPGDFEEIVNRALKEDIGSGDITSLATIPANSISCASLICQEAGVIFGMEIAAATFRQVDNTLKFQALYPDGAHISKSAVEIARITGSTRAILAGERVALNFLQRLSGIATITAACRKRAQKLGITILDTRKTTPTLRTLEKAAVRAGGGVNHRFGLFDAILIKDNHIKAAGSITRAMQNCREYSPGLPIAIEIDNLQQLHEVLAMKCDRVLLDNMSPAEIKECLQVINGRCFIEVSGGINTTNLDDFLLKGIDAISLGALTHSARALDISLELEG